MRLTGIKKQLEKFNKDLNEYYTETGETELYEVDTTVIGETSIIEPFVVREFGYGLRVENGNDVWRLKEHNYEGEWWIEDWEGVDGLKGYLQYYRRMLNKSWRIWRSENPDTELEKEDEE